MTSIMSSDFHFLVPESPKGNDRSPDNKQVFLNSSQVSKRFFQLVKDQILMSIKGCNSLANLQKMMFYNPNLDLVNDNVYTKFGHILSISSQDIE